MSGRFMQLILILHLLTLTRPLPLQGQTAGYDIIIPHLAVGGSYRSMLDVSDPIGLAAREVEVSFFDGAGNPLPLAVDGSLAAPSFRFSISRFEEKSFLLTAGGNAVRTGWARIACDRGAKLYASLRFLFGTSGTVASDVVGILPSGVQRTWYIAADRRAADRYTGVAVANPSVAPVDVEFNLYQSLLRVPGTTSVKRTLAPLGHLAVFTHELFPVTFNGLATLEVYGAQGNVAVTALHAEAAQYSSLPAHAAVEVWDLTVAGMAGGAIEKGTWCWKYNESTGFHGVESIDARRIDLRGSFEGNRFELVRFGGTGDAPGTDLHIYQGILESQGDRAVIQGKRLEIGPDGTVLRTAAFTATRLP